MKLISVSRFIWLLISAVEAAENSTAQKRQLLLKLNQISLESLGFVDFVEKVLQD